MPALVTDPEAIGKWIEETSYALDLPQSLIGREANTVWKPWDQDHQLNTCFVGSMNYTSYEGNLGFRIIYQMLNEQQDIFCDRCFFATSRKNLVRMNKAGIPFWGLQTRKPLGDFDVLMFGINYPTAFFNIPRMLNDSGIAPRHRDREAMFPVVMMGGGHRGNPEPFHLVPDIFYVGEAEANLVEVLREIRQVKDGTHPQFDMQTPGFSKWDFFAHLARTYEGIYVPAFYEEIYDEQTKLLIGRKRLRLDVPLNIKNTYPRNLDDAFVHTKPVLSFVENGMGLGEIEVSRGCECWCNFCQETFLWPYRERSVDVMIHYLKENVKYSGATECLPSAFDSSTYTERKQLLRRCMEEVAPHVTLLSQRADHCAADPNYIELAGYAGNDTCSIGVEGHSERMRSLVSKNASEDAVVGACRNMFKAGFRKVKLFMIANLPGETEKDVMEFIPLLEKIKQAKDETGATTQVLVSYCPLNICAWTPLQWYATTLEERKLDPLFKPIKDLGFDFRIGSGGKVDEAFYSQLIHLGDRRICELLLALALEEDIVHYGQMKKGTKDYGGKWVEGRGLSWEFYFREKAMDEMFPWSFLDFGLTEKYLRRGHKASIQEKDIAPCVDACTYCGICMTEPEMARQFEQLRAKVDPEVDLRRINRIFQTGTIRRGRFKIVTDPEFRYVERGYWVTAIRRAAAIAEIPIDPLKIQFLSDFYKVNNWLSGTDYVDLRFSNQVGRASEIVEAMNRELDGISFVEGRLYSPTSKAVRSVAESTFFKVDLPVKYSRTEAEGILDACLRSPSFVIKMKNEVNRQIKIEEVDARPWIDDMWALKTENGTQLSMLLRNRLSIYDLLPALYATHWRAFSRFVATAEDAFVRQDELQEDAFRPRCVECDRKIQVNLFDEPVNQEYCLRCLEVVEGEVFRPTQKVRFRKMDFAGVR